MKKTIFVVLTLGILGGMALVFLFFNQPKLAVQKEPAAVQPKAVVQPTVAVQPEKDFCEELFLEHTKEFNLAGTSIVFGKPYIDEVFYTLDKKTYQDFLLNKAQVASYALRMAKNDNRYAIGAWELYDELDQFLLSGAKKKIISPACVAASLTRTAEAFSRAMSPGCARKYIDDALSILSDSNPKSPFVEKELALAKERQHGIENMAKVSVLFGGIKPCEELPGRREEIQALISRVVKK